MDDVGFGALALALTLVGGTYTWWAYRHRGLAPALRGAALTLLPPAFWLTDTLRMLTRVVDAVGDWATGLVFDVTTWLGVVLAGVSVLLLGASRFVDRRRGGREAAAPDAADPLAVRRAGKAEPAIADDDDLAEVEAILRRRGIR